jgi:hypothetical protein
MVRGRLASQPAPAEQRRQFEMPRRSHHHWGTEEWIISEILGGFLRLFRRAGLLEVHAIQGFVTIPSVKKLVGLGTLSDGTCALVELDFVEAC